MGIAGRLIFGLAEKGLDLTAGAGLRALEYGSGAVLSGAFKGIAKVGRFATRETTALTVGSARRISHNHIKNMGPLGRRLYEGGKGIYDRPRLAMTAGVLGFGIHSLSREVDDFSNRPSMVPLYNANQHLNRRSQQQETNSYTLDAYYAR